MSRRKLHQNAPRSGRKRVPSCFEWWVLSTVRTDRVSWLLVGLVLGCASERHAAPRQEPALGAPVNAIGEAIAKRSIETRARKATDPLGSYWRRVWEQEFERLLSPLRASPIGASMPPELTGPTLADWQRRLNQGWKTIDPDPVLVTTHAVIAQAAPLRDQLGVWRATLDAQPELKAAVAQLESILVEIVQEAELLALRDSGQIASFEEFVARYPEGPYTGSVLFALGVLHEGRRDLADAKDAFRRLVERFPAHPLVEQAREKIQAL